MKLLIDMNISPRWVRFLSTADIEAIHWSSVGPDSAAVTVVSAIRRLAAELEKGALVTIDLTKTRLRMLPFFEN